MNKEKLMQFLSDAIDNGAKLEVLFYGYNKTQEQAANAVQQFKEIIGEGDFNEHTDNGFRWYNVSSNRFRLDHFYDVVPSHFMEEDVVLDGSEAI